jgi:hypothetical protein
MLYQQRVRKFKWLSAKFPNVSLVTPVGVLKKHAYAAHICVLRRLFARHFGPQISQHLVRAAQQPPRALVWCWLRDAGGEEFVSHYRHHRARVQCTVNAAAYLIHDTTRRAIFPLNRLHPLVVAKFSMHHLEAYVTVRRRRWAWAREAFLPRSGSLLRGLPKSTLHFYISWAKCKCVFHFPVDHNSCHVYFFTRSIWQDLWILPDFLISIHITDKLKDYQR